MKDMEDITAEQWEAARDYLDSVRANYLEVGRSGILALRIVIDPLYRRYASGERTAALYLSIMSLR